MRNAMICAFGRTGSVASTKAGYEAMGKAERNRNFVDGGIRTPDHGDVREPQHIWSEDINNEAVRGDEYVARHQ